MLLPCDRWQKGNLTKWCMIWKIRKGGLSDRIVLFISLQVSVFFLSRWKASKVSGVSSTMKKIKGNFWWAAGSCRRMCARTMNRLQLLQQKKPCDGHLLQLFSFAFMYGIVITSTYQKQGCLAILLLYFSSWRCELPSFCNQWLPLSCHWEFTP